jgi:small subunit ribosomal protein S3
VSRDYSYYALASSTQERRALVIKTLHCKLAALTASELHLNILEVRKPELDAQLVGESISQQLERRVSFRRAMKRAVQNAMRMGALVFA